MRILRIVLLILGASASAFAQTPPAAPQGTGRISGVITRLDTGRPVPNTTIRWVRWEGGRGTQGAVRTDAQGRFSMEKLVAGSYEITASAEGLVTLQYGQRATREQPKRIELMDGQQFTEADIVLPKTSAIEGQLLDEFGDPVPGVTVQIAQVQMAAGKTRLMPMGTAQQPAPSDDLGHFRAFNLPPGDYYVLALSGPFAGPETAAGFAVTYYPGTSQPTNAKAVHLETGQDATGVTFALEPAKVATVSGVAVDATGKPMQGMLILVQTAGDDVRAMVTARGAAGPDGTFTFRNVAHGTYALQAFGQPVGGGNLGKAPFGALPFTLGGDRDDLRIVIRDGAVARGRILIEGDASALKPELVRVIPGAVEFVTSPVAGGPPNTVTNPDWTFEVQNQSGLRAIRVSVGAQGWGVKQIMLHGKDITDTPVDFRSGDVNDIEITLSNTWGTVTGTVTDGTEPARDYAVLVFAEDATKWTFPSRFIASARPSPQGGFRVGALPAAAYLAVALPAASVAAEQDPAVLESLRAVATRVVVNEGETKSIALRIIKR